MAFLLFSVELSYRMFLYNYVTSNNLKWWCYYINRCLDVNFIEFEMKYIIYIIIDKFEFVEIFIVIGIIINGTT